MKLSTFHVVCYALCVLLSGYLAGCARIADPRPPEHRVPEAVRDLEAHQSGDKIILSFSLPERNTDGSLARTIRSLEVFRIMEKAEDKTSSTSDAVSYAYFLNRATHVFSIPVARFPEYTRGNIFFIHDALPLESEEDAYSMQFRYAAVFVNERNQAAELGKQTVIRPIVLPSAPEGLAAVVAKNEIYVSWTPATESADGTRMLRIAGYNVYRSERPDEFPAVPSNNVPLPTAEYRDRDFQFDKNYYYAVGVVTASNPPAESIRSEVLKVETRNIFPPAPPGNFTVITENGRLMFFWVPSPSKDIAGYRIFRRNRSVDGTESRQPLHDGLITGISYRNENLEPDGDYVYEIQAVDKHDNAGEFISYFGLKQ